MGLMEELSGWLKQIVAVVLLAGLVDLLLPNRTMQRYVRLVAGLFILLTVMTPLLGWIRSDFGSKLAAGLDQAEKESQSSATELSRIQSEGRKWKERQQEEAAGVMASRLEDSIRSDVERSEGRRVGEVKVQMQRMQDGQFAVKAVTVTLSAQPEQPAAESTRAPDSKPMAEVQPVAPIVVEVPSESRSDGRNAVEDPPDRETRIRIAALIAARYGISEDLVQVLQPKAADNRR